eukprot:scaffold487_cov178-Ochromonas_danica.AAC.12
MAEVGSKRRRVKTSRYNFDFMENEEQKLLQQDTRRVQLDVPDAPVYYPTSEEFKDPIAYIQKIRPEAEPIGLLKIVPPPDWDHTCLVNLDNPKKFSTRLQPVHTLMQGQGFDDGKMYTLREYQEMADNFFNHWKNTYYDGKEPTVDMLAKDYWDMVETGTRTATVEYGNDIDSSVYGSGFPSLYENGVKKELPGKYSRWNLNSLPVDSSSLLRFLQAPVNGINVPWVYVGMLFATFCWHYEDNNLYSINYSHFGSVKQWYGVPGNQADAFEKVAKDYLMGLFREAPDLLHHMATQIPPSLLICKLFSYVVPISTEGLILPLFASSPANGINVYKASQEAGTFIITFPRSFHGGFGCGLRTKLTRKLRLGVAEERYRMFAREPIFRLYKLVIKSLEGEINSRQYLLSHDRNSGVRDLCSSSSKVVLPENNFTIINKKTIDYDDMRACALCKQICVFTAVGCECNRVQVACAAHYHMLCRCSKEKRFMLGKHLLHLPSLFQYLVMSHHAHSPSIAWAKTSSLISMKEDLANRLK